MCEVSTKNGMGGSVFAGVYEFCAEHEVANKVQQSMFLMANSYCGHHEYNRIEGHQNNNGRMVERTDGRKEATRQCSLNGYEKLNYLKVFAVRN